MPDLKFCMVTIHEYDMLTGEGKEQKMYCVQGESLGLILECLNGLVKLKRAKIITMDQVQAMAEIGTMFGGPEDVTPEPKTGKAEDTDGRGQAGQGGS